MACSQIRNPLLHAKKHLVEALDALDAIEDDDNSLEERTKICRQLALHLGIVEADMKRCKFTLDIEEEEGE